MLELPLPPGSLPTLWGGDGKYVSSYLTAFPGHYATGDSGYLDELLEWNGRGVTHPQSLHERASARLLALVLAPETHSAKAWPAKTGEHAEVVQVENPALREDLQAFLGIGL